MFEFEKNLCIIWQVFCKVSHAELSVVVPRGSTGPVMIDTDTVSATGK